MVNPVDLTEKDVWGLLNKSGGPSGVDVTANKDDEPVEIKVTGPLNSIDINVAHITYCNCRGDGAVEEDMPVRFIYRTSAGEGEVLHNGATRTQAQVGANTEVTWTWTKTLHCSPSGSNRPNYDALLDWQNAKGEPERVRREQNLRARDKNLKKEKAVEK